MYNAHKKTTLHHRKIVHKRRLDNISNEMKSILKSVKPKP